MRQYEIAIRIAQVHHLADERKYKKALAVIETLDVRQVRNVSDLKVFAEVYTRTEQFAAAKATYLRIYKKSRTRRVLYRMIYLAIRTNELEDAESFYKEFIKMNPNNRDALILRYRIDKAAGVPIGQLIEILKSLKEEEYIEEWAYELAKLYQQAGRYVECREECEDIKLWFGQGEIVERAKLLLEHIEERNPMPFLDDKDFTERSLEPNPDDTGSLPDLNEYLQSDNEHEMKLLKKVDPVKFEDTMEEMPEEQSARESAGEELELLPIPEQWTEEETLMTAATEDRKRGANLEKTALGDDFEDDYKEEQLVETDGALPKVADGIQKLFSIPFGNKKEDEEKELSTTTPRVTFVDEEEAMAEMAGGNPQPLQQTEPDSSNKDTVYRQINPSDFPQISQSGTGITQDLAAEISAIFEAEKSEQFKEKAQTVFKELPKKTNEVVERMMEAAASKYPTKEYIPLDSRRETKEPIDEDDFAKTTVIPTVEVPDTVQVEEKTVVENVQPEQEPEATELSAEALLMEALEAEVQAVEAQTTAPSMASSQEMQAQQMMQAQAAMRSQQMLQSQQRVQQPQDAVPPQPAVTPQQMMQPQAAVPPEPKATPQQMMQPQAAVPPQPAVAPQQMMQPQAAVPPQPAVTPQQMMQSQEPVPPTQAAVSSQPPVQEEVPQVEEAPHSDPMISESVTGEILPEKDLPTTRALHRSFADILILIGGELDPSHFVLMGDGDERILGITKKISTVMRETGYLSTGRIARISAEQLNQMDLIQFKDQLKGNCLLVTRAADLLFPTITKIFSIMDDYYGDFAVILSDDGATLDQLFRFVPALARRFKYIIDISQYTEQDYK